MCICFPWNGCLITFLWGKFCAAFNLKKWKFAFALFSMKWIIMRSVVLWLFYEKKLCKDHALQMKKFTFAFSCVEWLIVVETPGYMLELRRNIYYFLCFPVKCFGRTFFLSFDFEDTDNCQNKRFCFGRLEYFHFFRFCVCLVWSKCNCCFVEN